jgi:hypothetical protein
MTKTFAAHLAPAVFAALLTGAMFLATNALAAHQYRVAEGRQTTLIATADVRHLGAIEQRLSRA